MKSLFYCQHSVGIGHLVRTLRLAEASLCNGPAMLICGGAIPPQLQINSRIRVVALPPLRMNAENALVDANGNGDVDEIFDVRRQIIVRTVREFLPDAVVIEMFPFGRKKFATEVLSIIDTARERRSTKVFSSVRDVLVTSRRDQDRHDHRAATSLNNNFDAVLIHSDPDLIALDATFSTFEMIDIPTYYTGYISSSSHSQESTRLRRIVVSAGGGQVGHELMDAAEDAFPKIKRDLNLDMLIVTGPNGKQRQSPTNGDRSLQAVEFISDMPYTLARSMISVSQCGYNTAVDVLKTRTAAIFVPYETPSEDEQFRRAELLAQKGRAELLRQSSLTADAIADAAANLLSTSRKNLTCINLNGAVRSSDLIREVCSHA